MHSFEHKKYLKKLRTHQIIIYTVQILLAISLIIIWQILADNGIINTFICSSPKRVMETIISLYKTNNLFNHIFITLFETLFSFGIGTILGLFMASILWFNKPLAEVLDPYLTILNSLPKVALGPIIIIWVGAKMSSIIIMALLISVIIAIINIYEGFLNTDIIKINMMKSFGAKKKDLYFKLILPNSVPNIMNVIKVNISMSLIGVTMGEFLVSKEGIGYLITYGSQIFNLDLVMAGILILCIISYLIYVVITYIEKKIVKI